MATRNQQQTNVPNIRVLLAWLLPAVAVLLSIISLMLPNVKPDPAPTATEATQMTQAPTAPPTEPQTQEDPSAPSKSDPLLLLVNASHPLPEGYTPDLTRLSDWDLSVASVCYDDLKAMLAAGRAEGLSFQICSAYRTTEEQKKLFDEDVAKREAEGMSHEEALAETARYTMQAGCSEHETGLALDIVSMSYQNLDEEQAQTGETRWLYQHSWEYGFILRYPTDKADITGVAYESWHYRYVGREAAAYLNSHDLTLEEFME